MRVVDKPEALALLAAHPSARHSSGCMMCGLVTAATSSPRAPEHVAASEHGVLVLNRFAAQQGHLMVLTCEHVEHMHELSWATYADLQRLAYDATLALQRALGPLRVYCAALGSSAALAISYPHFHLHVIPVFAQGEAARPARVFSWSEGVTVYDDAEAAELVARVRAAWPEASPAVIS